MKKIVTAMLTLCIVFSLSITRAHALSKSHEITRLEFCQMIQEMLIDTNALSKDQSISEPFEDTDDSAVASLYTNKIIYGKSPNTFDPNGLLTREEAAVITHRIYNWMARKQDNTTYTADFKDIKQISSWALRSVSAMNKHGVIVGTPQGTFEPSGKMTTEHAKLILLRLQRLCAPQTITQLSLEDTLKKITASPRMVGTQGEQKAAQYIFDTLKDYGYIVTKQTFEFADKKAISKEQISNMGTNIIATKQAPIQNPDILIISAHYDTVSGTVGANDNASGITVLLELAKALEYTKTDTEIRFIAFSGEEEGLLGSTYYVNHLQEQEKARMIGDIQMDVLGHYMSKNVQINTPNGAPTLIGNMINENAKSILGSKLLEKTESASDHMSFVRGGIPAVLVMQNNLGVENHNVCDNVSIIDFSKIKPISEVLLQTIKDVMSDSTISLSKMAYEISDMKNPSYIFGDETIFFFGEKKQLNDGRAGGPGTLTGQRHDDALNWDFEYYYYNAKWFEMDTSLPTVFEYRVLGSNRYLQNIYINTEEAGYSENQTLDLLKDKFGEPTKIIQKTNGNEYIWSDSRHQKQYILRKKEGKWIIHVYSAFFGAGETINKYDLTDGIEKYKGVDPLEYKLLEFTEKLTENYPAYIDTLEVWSDGLSYQLGAEYLTDPKNNDRFTLRIDITDVFDKNGNFRNLDKTLRTFVHEFGHVITLNHTQTDISKRDPNKFYYTPECFRKGSYILEFYNKFWKELNTESGASLYFETPDLFVDQYSSQNVNEDIAESFMLFVLSNRPTGNSIAEQKIQFFYSYPDLVKLRDNIRENFKYQETESVNNDNDNSSMVKEQVENTVYSPQNALEITDIFAKAIPVFAEHISFDLSSMHLAENQQKITVMNAYYNTLSKHPDLKYAYNIEMNSADASSVVKCNIKYIPYKLGTINENTLPSNTYKINTLKDVIAAAQDTIGKESASIAILNPKLKVDDIQNALMQAGYGYIVFVLNNDGTKIKAMPTNRRTMDECVDYINKTKAIADDIIKSIIKDEMSDDEKLYAIYDYVTSNVVYDQRYYSAPKTMPYESTTAYSALHDNVAICGGFSWAVNVLAEKAGIECYNVSGRSYGQYHMWNIAKYDGEFYYFDATFDRGINDHYKRFAKKADELAANYTWNEIFTNTLIGG